MHAPGQACGYCRKLIALVLEYSGIGWCWGFLMLRRCFKYCSVLSNDDLTQVSGSQKHSVLSPLQHALLHWANLKSLANFELLNLFNIISFNCQFDGFPGI